MKSNENDHQGKPNEQDDLSLKDVDSFVHYMKGLVEELFSKIRVLPKVDQEGNSECPFAEDLYAQKDESMEKVEKESQKLPRYLGLVEKEIARCSANLEQISADRSSLNLEEAKEKYNVAKRSQESQYNSAIQQRKALVDLISRTEQALAMARSKEFPGRKPQKSFRPPAGRLGGWGTSGSTDQASKGSSPRPSLETEIDTLISLGPLGRRDS